ncbi:hypothetical protein [Sinorhizobium meliloti]|uniref:hypothetical protein n=1 Tax=Rhizobium meliloti TaxID=382 RepID=UPI0012968BA2|nr:hypothetical protein [Sinorhizobium meliloti]MDW9491710.1 hypothetical protein [Sinorhizobium meliloti]MQV02976.1 hypothetical protein [Sinorhizobium meliloti]
MERDETPTVEEITGYIAHDLAETYKSSGIEVESWDDLGDMELKFPDGKKYRIEVIEMDDE